MKPADSVTVTARIAVDPASAFDVFTREIHLWWKRGSQLSSQGRTGPLRLEPRAGGRLLEVLDEASGETLELGRVRAWEPPGRLVLSWRLPRFAPGEATEVEVRFEAEGGGTRVTLVHRGWNRLPADHPIRHGFGEPAFSNLVGTWWAEALVALQAFTGHRPARA